MKEKIVKKIVAITVTLSLCWSFGNVAKAENEGSGKVQENGFQSNEDLRLLTYEEYEAELADGAGAEAYSAENEGM